jgi:hypothetical protein
MQMVRIRHMRMTVALGRMVVRVAVRSGGHGVVVVQVMPVIVRVGVLVVQRRVGVRDGVARE